MECQYFKKQFTSLLTGSLDKIKRQELEIHLVYCQDCRKEFIETQKIWNLLGEIPDPVPSDTMRARFNIILKNFKEESIVNKNPFLVRINKIREYSHMQLRPHFALSTILLIIGLIIGYSLNRSGQTVGFYNRQIDSLSSQLSDIKQVIMLTLLQNPSASQRILAVGYTDEIDNVNNKVIEALLTTLNEDPNVNVRLMTLEALVKYSNEPRVREGLVQSITLQESPLLQSAIADVMVKLQEKRSIQSLQQMLNKSDLNKMVKLKIEQSIHKLI